MENPAAKGETAVIEYIKSLLQPHYLQGQLTSRQFRLRVFACKQRFDALHGGEGFTELHPAHCEELSRIVDDLLKRPPDLVPDAVRHDAEVSTLRSEVKALQDELERTRKAAEDASREQEKQNDTSSRSSRATDEPSGESEAESRSNEAKRAALHEEQNLLVQFRQRIAELETAVRTASSEAPERAPRVEPVKVVVSVAPDGRGWEEYARELSMQLQDRILRDADAEGAAERAFLTVAAVRRSLDELMRDERKLLEATQARQQEEVEAVGKEHQAQLEELRTRTSEAERMAVVREAGVEQAQRDLRAEVACLKDAVRAKETEARDLRQLFADELRRARSPPQMTNEGGETSVLRSPRASQDRPDLKQRMAELEHLLKEEQQAHRQACQSFEEAAQRHATEVDTLRETVARLEARNAGGGENALDTGIVTAAQQLRRLQGAMACLQQNQLQAGSSGERSFAMSVTDADRTRMEDEEFLAIKLRELHAKNLELVAEIRFLHCQAADREVESARVREQLIERLTSAEAQVAKAFHTGSEAGRHEALLESDLRNQEELLRRPLVVSASQSVQTAVLAFHATSQTTPPGTIHRATQFAPSACSVSVATDVIMRSRGVDATVVSVEIGAGTFNGFPQDEAAQATPDTVTQASGECTWRVKEAEAAAIAKSDDKGTDPEIGELVDVATGEGDGSGHWRTWDAWCIATVLSHDRFAQTDQETGAETAPVAPHAPSPAEPPLAVPGGDVTSTVGDSDARRLTPDTALALSASLATAVSELLCSPKSAKAASLVRHHVPVIISSAARSPSLVCEPGDSTSGPSGPPPCPVYQTTETLPAQSSHFVQHAPIVQQHYLDTAARAFHSPNAHAHSPPQQPFGAPVPLPVAWPSSFKPVAARQEQSSTKIPPVFLNAASPPNSARSLNQPVTPRSTTTMQTNSPRSTGSNNYISTGSGSPLPVTPRQESRGMPPPTFVRVRTPRVAGFEQ
eukprot:TRINITY_DN29517_c0_g2_i1.p1 TRINITY_DN29517_c0_g2~~TRINITY_DN29517_c0_g2_i1.p1  ORF type:complete len:976 (-),score=181.95 TRINITY_DN29517_c0_g2_i1:14-2941(-)